MHNRNQFIINFHILAMIIHTNQNMYEIHLNNFLAYLKSHQFNHPINLI